MVVLRAVGLLTVPILIHILNLPLYGVWTLSGALMNSQGLFDFGFATSVTRFMAEAHANEDRRTARRLLLRGLAAYGLLSILFAAAVLPLVSQLPDWLGVPASGREQARTIIIATIWLFGITNIANVFFSVLQGLQRITLSNTAIVGSQLVYVPLLLATWLAGWGVVGLVFATTALYLFQVAALGIFTLMYLPRGNSASVTPSLGKMLNFGFGVQGISIADFLASQGPRFVTALLLGAAAAGRLDLAMRLPVAATAVALPILPPLLPAAARLKIRGDSAALSSMYSRATRYLASVAAPALLCVFLLGPWFAEKWLGTAAAGLDAPIRLLAIGMLARTLSGVAFTTAIGAGAVRLAFGYTAVLFVITAVTLALASRIGIVGIAAGITLGSVAALMYLASQMSSVVSKSARNEALSILAIAIGAVMTAAGAAVLPWVILHGSGGASAASVVVALAVFGFLSLRFGLISRGDLRDIMGRAMSARSQ
jgi:O-antigen/teichoic acid export membrane protein